MPLGILSDDVFQRELEALTAGPVTAKIVPRIGQGSRGNEVPEVIRNLVAVEANKGSKQTELAEAFGIPQSSVSAYANAMTSAGAEKKDEQLLQLVNDTRKDISKSARDKLHLALESITHGEIAEAPLKVKSQVAKDMSAIVKNLEPEVQQGVNVNFFEFHAPKMKDVNDYKVIDVTE